MSRTCLMMKTFWYWFGSNVPKAIKSTLLRQATTDTSGPWHYLGLFDGWFASNDRETLSPASKARRLVHAFGNGGFDYLGNDRADLPVWAVARQRVAVRPTSQPDHN